MLTINAGIEDNPGVGLRRSPLESNSTSSAGFTIRLFGALDVRCNGVPLPKMRSRKEEWILALLVLRARGKPLDRSWLAGTLWPESRESSALFYLRRSLTILRDALGPEADRISSPTPRTLQIDLLGADCDVVAFEEALRGDDEASLRRAVDLYRGPLFDGCAENWILSERARCTGDVLRALRQLSELTSARGDSVAQMAYLRRIVELDPFDETALRALMSALATGGNRAAVDELYLAFQVRIHEELNAEPGLATVDLYQQILTESRPSSGASDRPPAPVAAETEPRPSHLPAALSRLIGRQAERDSVIASFEEYRLVTLTGTGGVGKTRLSLAVAEAISADFADGAWFVDLALVENPELLTATVLSALGVEETRDQTHEARLESFLRPKRLLLVLDNCEHMLADCARLLQSLLVNCPHLQVLATSRESLRTYGEAVWPVRGLVPEEAVRLFAARASQVSYTFQMDVSNISAVSRICDRLEGIPLAIELAAARIRGLSALQIAENLDGVFRLLNLPGGNMEPRHQTLRATLNWSYDLLTEAERVLLARLSIFGGGWTLESATAICDGDPLTPDSVVDQLLALVDKSLVVYTQDAEGEGRYRFLETTRAYAEESLADRERERLMMSLTRYFLQMALTAKTHWQRSEETLWMTRLEHELPNIRVALRSGGLHPAIDEAGESLPLRLATALLRFWWQRGHIAEGCQVLHAALNRCNPSDVTETRAAALNARGFLASRLGNANVLADHQEALRIRQTLGDKRGTAVSLHNIADFQMTSGDLSAAIAAFTECVALYRELGDEARVASNQSLLNALIAASGEGMSDTAARDERHALEMAVQRGDPGEEFALCLRLASGSLRRGRPEEARDYIGRCLVFCASNGGAIDFAMTLELAAVMRGELGHHGDVPLLYGVVARVREECACPGPEVNRGVYEQNIAQSRAILGDEVFDAAWAAGGALTKGQAIELALSE